MESHQLSSLDLTANAYLDYRPITVAAMLSLFERSGCFLKVLTLDSPPPAKGLKDLLQATLSLERLATTNPSLCFQKYISDEGVDLLFSLLVCVDIYGIVVRAYLSPYDI